MTALAAASTTAVAAPDITIAVLYFDYDGSSEEMGFLRKGLNQMLVTDLVDTPGVTVVERVRLEEVLAELELNRKSTIDRASAVRVGKLLGARYLIMGGYFDFKDQLHVSIKIVNVETGAIVGGVRDRKKSEDFWALEQHLAAELGKVIRDKITAPASRGTRSGGTTGTAAASAPGAGTPGAGEQTTTARTTQAAPRARPKTLGVRMAARYGRALDAMDRGDTGAARAHLEAVVKETPDFEMAAVDLASLAK